MSAALFIVIILGLVQFGFMTIEIASRYKKRAFEYIGFGLLGSSFLSLFLFYYVMLSVETNVNGKKWFLSGFELQSVPTILER